MFWMKRNTEKNRLQVYRFLIDAAGDGMVAPTILPGSQKLGEERSSLYLEAVEGEGVLMDEYRSRKLFDRYLEPVASQFDLTFPEIRLLLYLSHLKQPVSRRELSDYTNMTRRSLSLHLQKLMAKGYIRIQESREKKTQDRRITVWMLPEAAQVEEALVNVQREYDETRYQSFSEDELLQYAYLTEKNQKEYAEGTTINMQKNCGRIIVLPAVFYVTGKVNEPKLRKSKMKKELELYLHIPFCIRKCEYCDFLSGPADEKSRRVYLDAMLRELAGGWDLRQKI